MRWWDIDPCVAIERRVFPDDSWSRETFWSELAERATRTYVVAEAGGGVVGYAGIAVVTGEADLQTVAVDRTAQGRGLGRRLVREVTAAAVRAGARRMHLEVRADNRPALSLYLAEGWSETGRRRGYYRTAAGGTVDAVLMTRRLDG
jgi:ribosomal-protein-alanine N-acetyltransferase